MDPSSPKLKPKKKFSLRHLRARFASQSGDLPELPHTGDITKLFPSTPSHSGTFPLTPSPSGTYPPTPSPSGTAEWNPPQLTDSGYATPSPSASSHTSFRGDKHLPPPPSVQPLPPPVPIAPAEPAHEPSELPWASAKPNLTPVIHSAPHDIAIIQPTVLNSDRFEDESLPVIRNHADEAILAPVAISLGLLHHPPDRAFQRMKDGVNDLPVEVPGLLNILDEIAKVHVTISVVVLAFKAAYNMERTRRDNDKRISILYVSMKDMLLALIQLRNIQDPVTICPDGQPLEGRLQHVSKIAAQNIKDCANLCDTYQKKTLLIKVLRSQVWESRLASYISVFAERRRDFELALAIHTATAVDSMSSTVDEMNQRIAELTALVSGAYRREWRPSGEAQLAAQIAQKGGVKAVENSDSALSELAGLDNDAAVKETAGGAHATAILKGNSVKSSTFTLQDLKDELHEDWESAIAKNMETFEGKFALYQRQLQEELSRAMREESNRIIDELNKGPHDKIKDKELREIWKEMDWKLNVKARLFVMTLRDHYRDRADSTVSFGQAASDEWAFEFISAKYLQPIMESFDDDGSGYVTYQEVNEFVEAKPDGLNWSFPHWVAYWAVGWQAICSRYCSKILSLFDHLFAIRGELLPENRYWADYYLRNVWPVAFELIKAFRPANIPEHIEAKFQAFADLEEERIRRNLADIRFDIDALDTVYVVAGPGRIEKYLFPLVYLLLKRDVEVFHVAQKTVLHKEELLDSADSLLWVFRAVNYRYLDLSALFKQNHENVDSQMKIIACGLFEYLHNPASLWTWHNLRNSSSEVPFLPEIEAHETGTGNLSVLNYEPQNDHRFKCEIYESSGDQAHEADSHAPMPVRAVLREWNGYVFNEEQYPTQLMVSFRAHAVSASDPQRFVATGIHDAISFAVSGRCWTNQDGNLQVQFSIRYGKEYSTQYFYGHLDDSLAISGTVGWDEDPSTHDHRFFLKSVPAGRYLRYRPSPQELANNKARALWQFATSAVLHRIRRQRWTWTYINERRETRLRYIELSIRFSVYGHSPNEQELAEWTALKRAVSPIDASFFRILRDARLKTIPAHDCYCRGCGGKIGGARVVCMDCLSSESEAKTVDFCDRPECWKKTISIDPRNSEQRHQPSHDVLKVRTVLHLVDVSGLLERAENALSVSREYFQGPEHHLEDTLAAYYDNASEHAVATTHTPRCGICQSLLEQPCWFCVECFNQGDDVYICDDCESQTLIRCVQCERAFKQPTWYYGAQPIDNFLCSTCTATREEVPGTQKHKQHRYTHPLVRCTRKAEDEAKGPAMSTDERMSALEDTVWMLNGKIERMEGTLARIERLLLASLAGNRSVTVEGNVFQMQH